MNEYDKYERRETERLPNEYRPISAWGYIGYGLLFAIPILGLIIAIVFSLSNENVNRRNLASSHIIGFVIAIIVCLIVICIVWFSVIIGFRRG